MIIKRTPQAASPLASWFSYLENLHSKTIGLGFERVGQVAARLGIPKPVPFVFTVAGTSGKGTTCRTLKSILMTTGYKAGVYSSPYLVRCAERACVQGQELPELVHTAPFAETESTRDDISLTHFEHGTLLALRLLKQIQSDVVILEVGLGSRLDATSIIDVDVVVVASIALDHTDWLGPDRESIGREKADIFRSEKPAIVGEPEMPSTVADVAQEKGVPPQCQGAEWNYSVIDHDWTFSDTHGTLENLLSPLVSRPNAATALAALRTSGLEVSENAICDGIASAILPGHF